MTPSFTRDEVSGLTGAIHLALATPDIIDAVDRLTAAGIEFLPTPTAYYEDPATKGDGPENETSSGPSCSHHQA